MFVDRQTFLSSSMVMFFVRAFVSSYFLYFRSEEVVRAEDYVKQLLVWKTT